MPARPSGAGSNSRRFATLARPDGSRIKVPVIKYAGTIIYLATDDGGWPTEPYCILLADISWLEEGKAFDLEETAAGRGMGKLQRVRVLEVRETIGVDSSGDYHKYGQVKRLVLVTPAEDYTAEMQAPR